MLCGRELELRKKCAQEAEGRCVSQVILHNKQLQNIQQEAFLSCSAPTGQRQLYLRLWIYGMAGLGLFHMSYSRARLRRGPVP